MPAVVVVFVVAIDVSFVVAVPQGITVKINCFVTGITIIAHIYVVIFEWFSFSWKKYIYYEDDYS